MAILSGAVNTFTHKGQAEDFENAIYNVSPWETPALTAFGRSKASAKLHKWQTDVLAAAATNAALEGDDAPAMGTIAPSVEVGNHLQISRKTVGVAGTFEVVDKYGRTSEMAYQMARAAKELKVDIDYAISQNQTGSVGTVSLARTSGSLDAWIQTNQYATAGASTNTAGSGWTTTGTIGASTSITSTTSWAYTEAALKTILTTVWTAAGGTPDLLLMSGKNKARMSASTAGVPDFAGVATRFRDVGAKQQATIISGVDLFVSDFGTHKIVPSRQVRDQTVYVLNTDYWSVAYLRPFQTIELAKTGDHTRKMLLAEWTLVAKNEKSSGKLPGLSTT